MVPRRLCAAERLRRVSDPRGDCSHTVSRPEDLDGRSGKHSPSTSLRRSFGRDSFCEETIAVDRHDAGDAEEAGFLSQGQRGFLHQDEIGWFHHHRVPLGHGCPLLDGTSYVKRDDRRMLRNRNRYKISHSIADSESVPFASIPKWRTFGSGRLTSCRLISPGKRS